MASSYVNDLRLNEMATGDQSGTWGNTTNTNLELIAEAFGFGTEAITTNADTHTSTIADGATDPARAHYIKYTGTLDSACTITIGPNTINRFHIIENATSGSQNIIISQGSGSNVTIAAGTAKAVYLDGAGTGAAVTDAFGHLSVVDLTVDNDSNFNGDTHTFTSANSTDPLLIIKNTTNDANGSRLHFVKDKGAAGADGDDIGTIEFISDDDGQNQTSFAKIVAEVSESANTDEAGKLSFFVAESDGTTTALTAGLILEGEHATDGEVDVTIGAGAASTTTISGILDINGKELILDADADTSITADTDDQIDIKVGGTDTLVIIPDAMTLQGPHPSFVLTDSDDTNGGGIFYNNGTLSVAADTGNTGATGLINFQIDGNTDVTIDGGGDLTIADGNLVIGTSGHGIDFSAVSTSASGSASALLDDYEEGTFTLSMNGFAFQTNSTGRYIKIGKFVHFTAFIHALGSQNSNTANLSLPFTIDANAASSNVGYYTVAMAFTSAHNVNTGTHPSVFMSSGGNSYVTLRTHEEDGARANSSNSDFSSEDQMFVSGMYIASS